MDCRKVLPECSEALRARRVLRGRRPHHEWHGAERQDCYGSKSHVPPPGESASPTTPLGTGSRSYAGRHQGRASVTAVFGGPDVCLSLCEYRALRPARRDECAARSVQRWMSRSGRRWARTTRQVVRVRLLHIEPHQAGADSGRGRVSGRRESCLSRESEGPFMSLRRSGVKQARRTAVRQAAGRD
jgi:hypothetical protein